MANGYFVVQNGLTVGPLTIDATNGDINTSGNVSITGNLGVSQISKNDSSVTINDTGTGSSIVMTIDGATETTIDAAGLKLPSGDAFYINGSSVLNATTLGSGVLNSSLTSVGTLSGLTLIGALNGTSVSAATIGNTGTTLTGTLSTATQNSVTTMTGLTSYGTAGVTTTASGDLTVSGNLLVNGTTVTINATSVTTNDKNIIVANNQSTSAGIDGAGIDAGGGTPIATWRYNNATTTWQSNVGITPAANASVSLGGASNWWNDVYAVTFRGVSTTAKYADLAENYAADAEYEPGTVVCFGGAAEVTRCDVDHCRRVAGVVSTDPAYLMNSDLEGTKAAVALQGRVPCKVVGPVRKGDMMVSAGNGHARAEADPKTGTVIGKALEDFDGAAGVIEVVIGRV